MTKLCRKCGVVRDLAEYSADLSKQIGVQSACKQCKKQELRAWRSLHKEYDCIWAKRKNRTLKGHLSITYTNMQNRVRGIVKKCAHLYKGLPLISRREFYQWAIVQKAYTYLYLQWREQSFSQRFTPSIDRIDAKKGYVVDNMRFVPQYINASRSFNKGMQ